MYPRELDHRDNKALGRIRIQLKLEDGSALLEEFKTSELSPLFYFVYSFFFTTIVLKLFEMFRFVFTNHVESWGECCGIFSKICDRMIFSARIGILVNYLGIIR